MDKTESLNNLMIEDRRLVAGMSAQEYLNTERDYYKWKNKVRFMNPKPHMPSNLKVWCKGAKSIINWDTHYSLEKDAIYAIRSWGKIEVSDINVIRIEGIPYKEIYENSIKQAKSVHNLDSNEILYKTMNDIRMFQTTITFKSESNQDLWLRISGRSALSYSIRLIHDFNPDADYNISAINADGRHVEQNTSLVPLYERIQNYKLDKARGNQK